MLDRFEYHLVKHQKVFLKRSHLSDPKLRERVLLRIEKLKIILPMKISSTGTERRLLPVLEQKAQAKMFGFDQLEYFVCRKLIGRIQWHQSETGQHTLPKLSYSISINGISFSFSVQQKQFCLFLHLCLFMGVMIEAITCQQRLS